MESHPMYMQVFYAWKRGERGNLTQDELLRVLAMATNDMRRAQRLYFKTKDWSVLCDAKRFEGYVDDILSAFWS